MADLAATVLKTLMRFGQPCVVRWPAKGTGSLAIPAATENSFIRLKSRSVGPIGGPYQVVIEGQMPPTVRNLQGATIVVAGRTYSVASNTEQVFEGDVIQQRVVLA